MPGLRVANGIVGRPQGGPRKVPPWVKVTAVVATPLACLAAIVAVAVFISGISGNSRSSHLFGVLEADPRYLGADARAGIRLATLNINWSNWEPSPASDDENYIAQQVAAIKTYRGAGWKIAVDIGLQEPPQWVLNLADGQLQDQSGALSGTADYEFSRAVRDAAQAYIASVVHTLGAIDYYRIGLSPFGEMIYPEAPNNEWWAFSPTAQGTSPGLPDGVASSPMPGWVPGASTWQGKQVTPAQVQSWYDWYLGALTNAHAWEIDAFRGAGYSGQLQLVMPGDGAKPAVYSARIVANLAEEPYDTFHTMNTGAVWWSVLDHLPLTSTVVDISSVGDGSGTHGCQATDASVNYLTAPDTIGAWSDTRWLTYLAHLHGLAAMGENPGNTVASQLPTVMGLVQSCNLIALQWAWDYQLRDGVHATITDYASAIRSLP